MSKKIGKQDFIGLCTAACESAGFSADDARITAEVLVDADMMGVYTHGTKNLGNYIKKTRAGGIKVDANIGVVSETGGLALMDAGAAMGPLAAVRAMERAVSIAGQNGVGFVCLKNATHFGAAYYYALMAAQKGMIGLAMSNTDPNMAVPGGRGKIMGNSPFAYAAPTGGDPVFLDIAMSATAALKIFAARDAGVSIPDNWMVDEDGLPTTDPSQFPAKGSLQPMAGHKGYGLSMMVEIITGVLAGGALLHAMPSWLVLDKTNNVTQTFVAIDIAKIMPAGQFEARMDEYVDAIKSSPLAKGAERIYVPGEMELAKKRQAEANGLFLPPDVAASIEDMAKDCGLTINWR